MRDETKDPRVPKYTDGTSSYKECACLDCGQTNIPKHVIKWDYNRGMRATKQVPWRPQKCIRCQRVHTNFMEKQRADRRKQVRLAQAVEENQAQSSSLVALAVTAEPLADRVLHALTEREKLAKAVKKSRAKAKAKNHTRPAKERSEHSTNHHEQLASALGEASRDNNDTPAEFKMGGARTSLFDSMTGTVEERPVCQMEGVNASLHLRTERNSP